ncbi:aminodeoxychorismate/anthranilate synthase component II [Helicobacter sp. 11S03491-1]|uniref:anthranilate synthase component II n=1 Tax=Helicobacter sp. 11S03491-1 TaxID=1476196 RepID=UPI000BA52A9B|nr:aminodeoxychorismate/anthranilate synthase component II [Helicobacter sp. 11S03491-1]PAF41493.1 hypothetical protein BKH45_07170 [Helicobacter sp. 11S03491-1]
MSIALIDNYDSFTYNLAHMIEMLGYTPDIYKSDQISLEKLRPYTHLIISPGFGNPKDAGISMETIKHYQTNKKILGVCLGHQCIAEVFGGKVSKLKMPIHGKASLIKIFPCPLFRGLPNEVKMGRYHSLHVSSLSSDLLPLGFSSDGILMALRHKDYEIYGVQFHPESILSTYGKELLKNFLDL